MAKKQITFWIDEKTREKFSRLYNTSMSRFFRNCIKLALTDKQFFNDVYFMDFSGNEKSGIECQDSIF